MVSFGSCPMLQGRQTHCARRCSSASPSRLARRMRMHNGYKTINEGSTLAQPHPSTARMSTDDDGLLPEWVIYHELVATQRIFLNRALPHGGGVGGAHPGKLRGIDVARLSGGATTAKAVAVAEGAADAGAVAASISVAQHGFGLYVTKRYQCTRVGGS